MDAFLEWNMNVLRAIASLRTPILDFFMSALTYVGGETVFLVFSLVIFWCYDKNKGYFILSVGYIGTIINQFLKIICMIPRPWVIDPNFSIVEAARAEAYGYSFPSGHAQNAVATFGGILLFAKKKWLRVLLCAALVLIPFSRMYLGVHTPFDVFASIIISTVLIFAAYPLFLLAEKKEKLYYIIFGGAVAVGIFSVLFAFLFNFPENIDMQNLYSFRKTIITLTGSTLGVLILYPIESKFIRFDPKVSLLDGKLGLLGQAIKMIIGLVTVLGVKEGLKVISLLAGTNEFGEELLVFRFFRYFAVVAVTITVVPLIFKLILKIKNRSNKNQGEIQQ